MIVQLVNRLADIHYGPTRGGPDVVFGHSLGLPTPELHDLVHRRTRQRLTERPAYSKGVHRKVRRKRRLPKVSLQRCCHLGSRERQRPPLSIRETLLHLRKEVTLAQVPPHAVRRGNLRREGLEGAHARASGVRQHCHRFLGITKAPSVHDQTSVVRQPHYLPPEGVRDVEAPPARTTKG